MNVVRLLLALCCAGLSPAHAAQEAEPAPSTAEATPDAETLAAALALFEGQDLEAQLLASALHMARASMETEVAALEERGIALPESLTAKIEQLMFAETRAMVDEMAPTFQADAAAVYARYFTAAELRELKRLQAHPVMKKAETLSPRLLSDLSRIGMKVAAARMPEIQRKARQLVEEWLQDETMADEGPTT